MSTHHPSTESRPTLLVLVATSLVLPGCMNLSGLDGSTHYACKAPDGVACDSVSGTYANAIQNNLPSQRGKRQATAPRAKPSKAQANGATRVAAQPLTQAVPLRSSARILRLWIKPWEDTDLDLHDQGYVYVQVDSGQWLIDRAQRQIRDAYAPIRPPIQRFLKPATSAQGSDAPPLRPGPIPAPSSDADALLPPVEAPIPSAQ